MTTSTLECSENDCDRQAWSRGICTTHYAAANRGDYLDDYPTQKYMDNPDAYIRWAFGNHPELVKDIAFEFGLVVTAQS